MARTLLILVVTVFLFSPACKKKPLLDDYLIFGVYFTECGGDCAQMYLYKNNKLFADKQDYFDPIKKQTKFRAGALSDSETEIAKNLTIALSDFFSNTGSQTFGCPGCKDWPAYYLEIRKNRTTKKYLIDAELIRPNSINSRFFIPLQEAIQALGNN